MQRVCECGCGATFEAERRTARFASPTCRKRASRAQRREPQRVAEVVKLPTAKATSAPPTDGPTSVQGAVETGDELAMLRVLRLRVAKAVDDPNCPARDLAALQRSLREISREIAALELAAKQEAAEEVPADVPLDAASV